MQKKLDYSIAWADTISLLKAHREAVVAIAGFFLFAVGWATAFLVPSLDMEGVETLQQILVAVQDHFTANWMYLVPAMIVGSYGGFVIYVLFSGQNLSKVGDALTIALSRFLPYFVASLLIGWLTAVGFIALFIPGLYLFARFAALPAAMAADATLGVIGGIRQSWALTDTIGWRTFVLMFVVIAISWLAMNVLNLIIGIVCAAIAGPESLKLLLTFFAALFSTAQAVILIALVTAIYRQLKPQAVS